MADAFLKQYGGSGADSSDCTAKKSQVLAGVTAITSDSNDEAEAGTMPERGALNRTLAAGQSVTLPEGHYTGGTVSAQSLASQTGGATAEDRYVKKGLTYWKDGVLRTGTMETQSAISFSAAALSHNTIRVSWKNPAKGPWEGIIIRMSTSGTPGVSGGTEKYRGAGNNPNQGGGNNYVDITGLSYETTYYFTCISYYTGLDNAGVANVQAKTAEWWDTSNAQSMAIWVTPNKFPAVLNDVDGKFKNMVWSAEGAKAIAGSSYALNALAKNKKACMYANLSATIPSYYDIIVNSLANTGYFAKKSNFTLSPSYRVTSSSGDYPTDKIVYSAYPTGRDSTNSTTWEESFAWEPGTIVVTNKHIFGYNGNTPPSNAWNGVDVEAFSGEKYNGVELNTVYEHGSYENGASAHEPYKKYANAGLANVFNSRFTSQSMVDGPVTTEKNIVCFGPARFACYWWDRNSRGDDLTGTKTAYFYGNMYSCI